MYELLLFRGRDTIPPPTLEPRLSFGSGLNASGHRGALSPNTCTLEAALPEIGGAYYYQHLPARLQRAAVDGRRVFVALVDENWGDISSARPSRISSLCIPFTHAGIEWRRRYHTACVALLCEAPLLLPLKLYID